MKPEKPDVIRLHDEDNVVVAVADIPSGAPIPGENTTSSGPTPAGHKVATSVIDAGAAVVKYGQVIGVATTRIAAGEHVHSHNMKMTDYDRDPAISTHRRETEFVPEDGRLFFDGIVRSDDSVGTRNYVGVLSTVNCSATITHRIAGAFTREELRAFPNVDGVIALSHGSGCGGLLQDGRDLSTLRRVMRGYINHPNFGGVLILGLGCEGNHIDGLLDGLAPRPGAMIRTLNIQDAGGSAGRHPGRDGPCPGNAARGESGCPPSRGIGPADSGPGVRRFGCLVRNHGQSGPGRRGRSADFPGRNSHFKRNTGNLRGRTPADPTGRHSRGRGKNGRPDQVVAGIYQQKQRLAGNPPIARQPGRGADHDYRKITGRDRQGGNDQSGRCLRLCRTGDRQGTGGHEHARLRPGQCDRHGGGRREHDLFHPPAGVRFSDASRCLP